MAILFVSFGESNAGGVAPNASAMAWELVPRSELQIFNNTTEIFEDLDIGTNNNLGASGLSSANHGWELFLANRIRQGFFPGVACSLLQLGQGGATIADFDVGQSFWTLAVDRVAAVSVAVPGGFTEVVVLVSIGLNDSVEGVPLSGPEYRADLIGLLLRVRALFPGVCRFCIATLIELNAVALVYNAEISAVAVGVGNSVVVDANVPQTLQLLDPSHWGYFGMKRLGARFVSSMFGFVGGAVSLSPDWNVRGDGGYVFASGPDEFSHASQILDALSAGEVLCEFPGSASDDEYLLVLSLDIVENPWGVPGEVYLGSVFHFGGEFFESSSSTNFTLLVAAAPPGWARFRWDADGDDLYLDLSTDGGVTWVLGWSGVGVMTGVIEFRVKTVLAGSGGNFDTWSPEFLAFPVVEGVGLRRRGSGRVRGAGRR